MATRKFIPKRNFRIVIRGKVTEAVEGKEITLSEEMQERVNPNWGAYQDEKATSKK